MKFCCALLAMLLTLGGALAETDTAQDALSAAWAQFSDDAGAALDSAGEVAREAWKEVERAAGEIWEGGLDDAWADIRTAAEEAWDRAGEYAAEKGEALKLTAAEYLAQLEDWLDAPESAEAADLREAYNVAASGLGIGASEAEAFWTRAMERAQAQGIDAADMAKLAMAALVQFDPASGEALDEAGMRFLESNGVNGPDGARAALEALQAALGTG